MAAEGVDPCAERRAERCARFEDRASEARYGCGLLGTDFCAHHVSGASVTPNLYIGGRVTHIVEARLGEALG